jgi:hypothetical protein
MLRRFDEILDTFSKKIAYVRRGPIGVPKMFTIDLGAALVDQPFNISGNMFRIWSAPDEGSYITIRINETGEPAIPYQVHTGARTPFDKLLITTPAGQAGDMEIIYGTEAPEFLQMIDDRSTTVAGVGGVLDELRGDLTPENFTGIAIGAAPGATLIAAARGDRKSIIVQALAANSGNVFIGYANTVTVGGAPGIWVAELQPGMSYGADDYRGDIYGIATAAQVVGVGEV